MKHRSVKARIAAWMTLLTALLGVLLVVFMIGISHSVNVQTAAAILETSVKKNLEQIQFAKGKPQLESSFRFYQNGVTTLIYSKRESLLAGQIPVSFAASEPFQNGRIRTVEDRKSVV